MDSEDVNKGLSYNTPAINFCYTMFLLSFQLIPPHWDPLGYQIKETILSFFFSFFPLMSAAAPEASYHVVSGETISRMRVLCIPAVLRVNSRLTAEVDHRTAMQSEWVYKEGNDVFNTQRSDRLKALFPYVRIPAEYAVM